MASSDAEVLLDMGFEKERVELALKSSGGLQGALEWLEKNQDTGLEEIKESTANDNDAAPALQPGEEARSLVCNECGKKFRSQAQAEFHASKTEHVDFSESTDEIAPLTEEEKKAKLEALRLKLADKRAEQSAEDKTITKKNEAIRRKSTKETQDLKEDLKRKEQLKHVDAKKRERQEEVAAKERIRAKIKADQEERRLRTEKEKAQREGRAVPQASDPTSSVAASVAAAPAAGTPKPTSAYTETRLRLQTPLGTIQRSFSVDSTLDDVVTAIVSENGMDVQSITQNFPKKVFRPGVDFAQTLKQAGLVPSAALVVN